MFDWIYTEMGLSIRKRVGFYEVSYILSEENGWFSKKYSPPSLQWWPFYQFQVSYSPVFWNSNYIATLSVVPSYYLLIITNNIIVLSLLLNNTFLSNTFTTHQPTQYCRNRICKIVFVNFQCWNCCMDYVKHSHMRTLVL